MTEWTRRPEVELSAETRLRLAEVFQAFDYNQGRGDFEAEWCCWRCAVASFHCYLETQPALEHEQAWAELDDWVNRQAEQRGWT